MTLRGILPESPLSRFLWLASLVIGGALIALRFDEFVVGSTTDDAVYVELSRSLSEGRGPAIHLSECISYHLRQLFPLGYPVLLSGIAWIAPTSIDALKLLSVVATLSTILLLSRLLRPLAATVERRLLLALVLLNPWTIAYSSRVLSEAVYAACSLAAVLAYVTWRQREAISWHVIPVGLLVGLTVSVRTVGLAMVGAVLADLVLRRDWRRLGLLAPALALGLLPHVLATQGSLISDGYQSQVFEHSEEPLLRIATAAHHLVAYLKQLPAALIPAFGDRLQAMAAMRGLESAYVAVTSLFGLALLLLIALGLWTLPDPDDHGYRAMGLYLILYAGAMLNFLSGPLGIQLRFLVPILPLLYIGLLFGISRLAGTMSVRGVHVAIVALAAILPVSLAHNIYRVADPMGRSRSHAGRGFVDYARGAETIKQNTPPDAVIMTAYPLERHIHLNRPTVAWPLNPGMGQVLADVQRCHVRFILIAPGDPDSPDELDAVERERLAMLRSHPEHLRPVVDRPAEALYLFEVIRR